MEKYATILVLIAILVSSVAALIYIDHEEKYNLITVYFSTELGKEDVVTDVTYRGESISFYVIKE